VISQASNERADKEGTAVVNPMDQVASWPATASAGVASAAGLIASAGPLDRPFAWASVTKLLVALAALDGVQRGLLDLDEPAGPPGSPGPSGSSPPTTPPRSHRSLTGKFALIMRGRGRSVSA
jgi:CubicO group peptidase (beta-lactamase class C family)